jgi:hypothetical protein
MKIKKINKADKNQIKKNPWSLFYGLTLRRELAANRQFLFEPVFDIEK